MEDETVRSVNRDKGDVSDSSISSRDEFDPSNADTTSFDYCDGVILCLDVRGTAFGCSVLDFRTKVLKILPEDFQLRIRYGASSNGDACYTEEINDIVGSLILENTPTLCLVSTRLHESCYHSIKERCNASNFRLDLRSNEAFKNLDPLRDLVSGLEENVSSQSSVLLNDFMINSKQLAGITASTVACIISTYNKHVEMDNIQGTFVDGMVSSRSFLVDTLICDVEHLELGNRVFLDDATRESLFVFPTLGRTGEDKLVQNGCFSLFDLLNYTTSDLSRSLLRSWLVSPLKDKEAIEARHAIIKVLLKPENQSTFKQLQLAVKCLPNIFSILSQFQKSISPLRTWTKVTSFLRKCSEASHFVTMLLSNTTIDLSNDSLLHKVQGEVDVPLLGDLLSSIEFIIDFDMSKESKKVEIAEGVDPRLDECRAVYNNLETVLTEVSRKDEDELLLGLNEANITLPSVERGNLVNAVYVPQIGYLAAVEGSFEDLLCIAEGLHWQESFRTSTTIYLKTNRTSELDGLYGDIYASILDQEIEILYLLQEKVLVMQRQLKVYCSLFSELEVLISFARAADTHSYTEPILSQDDCSIDIQCGRHPIYETLVDAYIPNSCTLDGGKFEDQFWNEHSSKERIAIVTGANSSGKSVFLTQIGTIVFLAQVGSFVPAKSARIGIVDKILSKIRTKESLSNQQSSFELDSRRISRCLSLATERSLVLIDEYGKGTDSTGGPSLYGAIIKSFSQMKRCPRVIGTTHFHELFKEDILTSKIPGVHFYMTEILLDNEINSSIDNQPADNLGITFLYRIRDGICTDSFGIYCAKICGIKPEIVQRANEIRKVMNEGRDVVEFCGRMTSRELNEFQRRQNIIKRFLSWDLDLENDSDESMLREKLNSILSYNTFNKLHDIDF